MIYKTLMLQLYRPSKHKCALIDYAILQYSQALQMLISRYEYQIDALAESGARISKKKMLALIDKKALEELNRFRVQPFKDSLKIEFAALAASYVEQKQNNPGARYPLAYLDAAHYRAAVSSCIDSWENGEMSRRTFEIECSKLMDRSGRMRSLYFGRYAANRDYCLLYDRFKDRFYAKLYLLNAADGYLNQTTTSGLSLQYLADGTPPMTDRDRKKRYIVVPLAFGKRQYGDLKRALENPGILHTARLTKRDGRYFLMVNIACEGPSSCSVVSTMGVSRSPSGGVAYTICDLDGKLLEQGRVDQEVEPCQSVYVLSKQIVEIAKKNCSQVILEAKGGRNDRMLVQPTSNDRLIPNRQYTALAKILKYKLPEQRLPQPIEVSANSLFFTCPRCANRTARNRISDELFACIECGYASETEWIGSENLASRLVKYQRDKVPLTVSKKGNSLVFYNKNLGFQCVLPRNVTDYRPMYDALNQYLQSLDGIFQEDTQKYAVWKKLRQARDIRDAVRLISK